MTFVLRSYQHAWKEQFAAARREGFTRLLGDAPGGTGKTSFFASLAADEWHIRQGRTLVLENRDQLVRQTADRIRSETGLEVDIEMGSLRASPHAPVVVASVPTIGRVNRLTSFADSHFSLVVPDESHHALAPLYQRTMNYFHYGDASLAEDWQPPKDGTYVPKCSILGVTATPDLGGNKSLGSLYQKFAFRYSYLDAIEDGWLVGLKEVNIPVKIDTKKFRVRGGDFSADDEANAIIPIIEELAEQIATHARDRKTMAFLPSLECASLMADALNRRGLKSLFVSGQCLDKDEKTDEFAAHGPGICLCLCALYVEGTDFVDVDCVAWMRATISPTFYKQGIYRATRVLPGLVSDAMTAEQRRAAIASSRKPYSLIISPFFVSDRIDICSVLDLFTDRPELKEKVTKKKTDFSDAKEMRDYIASLEKAADKHRHKQARTINPVSFALAIGDKALANYTPESLADSAPPSREALDFLLERGIDTSAIKCAGEANLQIDRLRERQRLGLASPKQLKLLLQFGVPEEKAYTMRSTQAGAIIGKKFG